MDDLLRVPFVLLAVSAFLFAYYWARKKDDWREGTERPDRSGLARSKSTAEAGLQSGKQRAIENQPKPGSSEKRTNTPFIFSIIFFLSALLYIVTVILPDSYPEIFHFSSLRRFLLKNSGAFLNMALGVVYGFLLYGFYRFIKKYEDEEKPAPKLSMVAWVMVIVIVTAAGLFKTEATSLLASIKRLETPAGAIEFGSSVVDDTATSFKPGAGAPTTTETNFQAGTDALEATLRNAQKDFKNIVRFCGRDLAGGPHCSPFLGGADDEENEARQKRLLSTMAVTYEYASVIMPIATCLNAYADFYENGVPIQDDLSEIAASYATFPSQGGEGARCGGGREDPICEPLNRILAHMRAFRTYSIDQGMVENIDERCPKDMPTADEVISHRDAMRDRDGAGVILPYRSMLSAALLTASDYPNEAVGHMEREYKKLSASFGREGEQKKGSRDVDFVETVLLLPLLSGLQVASEHVRNQELLLKYQDQERDLGLEFLSSNFGVNGRQRGRLLEKCAESLSGSREKGTAADLKHSKAFRAMLQEPLTLLRERLRENKTYNQRIENEFKKDMEELNLESQQEIEEKWAAYVSQFILYFVNSDFKRLQAHAGQREDLITDEDLVAARKWWEIATERPSLIKQCFSQVPNANAGLYQYLKFHMNYTYGLLYAQKAAWLSQNAELARSGFTDRHVLLVDADELENYACMGYKGLRRAYNSGKGLEQQGWEEILSRDMWQTSNMLRRLVAYLERVGASCLH